MDEDLNDVEPIKKRNFKTIGLIIVVIALIALAASYSFESKGSSQSSYNVLHAKVSSISLKVASLSVNITNDGSKTWNVNYTKISTGAINCPLLPKIAPGASVIMKCSVGGTKAGTSYLIVIGVKDVDSADLYTVTSSVIAQS